jgi:hypothetical protein
MPNLSFLVAALLGLAPSTLAQVACGYPPKMDCLVRNAQYTILGDVISNTRDTTGTSLNYNATINIECLWATGQPGTTTGAGLQGSTITVTSFGDRIPNCPIGSTADASIGSKKIFFIHVRSNLPRPGDAVVYSIVDVCVGGQDYTLDNLKVISDTINAYPSNRIQDSLRGPVDRCSLTSVWSPSTSSSTSATSSTTTKTTTEVTTSTPVSSDNQEVKASGETKTSKSFIVTLTLVVLATLVIVI